MNKVDEASTPAMRPIDLAAERMYENRKAAGEDLRAAQSKFYWAVALAMHAHDNEAFKTISNKVVLEIGCASGEDALRYAPHAARYYGIDISDTAILNAQSLGLANAEFLCTDGHRLPLPDASIDAVIVNGLLHHLDLNTALSEINRVLNDGGVLIFREPLGTNPLFQLYRTLTPSARTADERPLTYADIRHLSNVFELQEVRWFGLLSLGSAFIRVAPLRRLLTKADAALAKTPLRFLCWQLSGFARKQTANAPTSRTSSKCEHP